MSSLLGSTFQRNDSMNTGYACITNPHCPGHHASKHQICSDVEQAYSDGLNELCRYIDLQHKLDYHEYAATTEKVVLAMAPVTRAVFSHSALIAALDQIELAACVDKDPEALRTAMIHIGELARDALKVRS
jgi:hypothetical protein